MSLYLRTQHAYRKKYTTKELQRRKYQLLIYICTYIFEYAILSLYSLSDIVTGCQYTLQFTKIEDIMSAPDSTCFVGSEEM